MPNVLAPEYGFGLDERGEHQMPAQGVTPLRVSQCLRATLDMDGSS